MAARRREDESPRAGGGRRRPNISPAAALRASPTTAPISPPPHEGKFLEDLDPPRKHPHAAMATTNHNAAPPPSPPPSSRSSSATSVNATSSSADRKLSQTTASSLSSDRLQKRKEPDRRPSTQKAHELQHMMRELWTKHSRMALRSRPSDPLTYAAPRKEAFLLYNKANTPTRRMDAIELWTIMALRLVLKNSILFSPVARTITSMGRQAANNTILDIHGAFKAAWGWQVAFDFPTATVYGYEVDHTGGLLNPGIPLPTDVGPPNYNSVLGHTLYPLPFEDEMFDVVTCKSLWYFVRADRWGEVLREMYRVLKPGGALELVVSDFDLLNKSPTDECWFSRLIDGVRRRGIDPYPSILGPKEMAAAGFVDINRCNLAMPRGWGGQIGQMTDFQSMYYTDAMFSFFADIPPEEIPDMKAAIVAPGTGSKSRSASQMSLIYGIKPS
jgi:SAM-dependent methyltransferase